MLHELSTDLVAALPAQLTRALFGDAGVGIEDDKQERGRHRKGRAQFQSHPAFGHVAHRDIIGLQAIKLNPGTLQRALALKFAGRFGFLFAHPVALEG